MAAIAAFFILTSTASCDKDDDEIPCIMNPSAIVTVKTFDNGHPYLQLDDSTALYPVNLQTPLYGGKEVRAMVIYSPWTGNDPEGILADKIQNVHVDWIDSILTKKPVPDLGDENVSKYGADDPVHIVDSWETCVEDGYLTLRFRTSWGFNFNTGIKHTVNLLTGTDPEDPYKVVFRHCANGDRTSEIDAMMADAVVAFNLSSLPDTEGKTVTLTLEWNSGESATRSSAKFKYRSRD